MNSDEGTDAQGSEAPSEPDLTSGGSQPGDPSEEELRERLEEEVKSLRVQDVLLQSVVSIINLSARRIGKEDEQDLEQARVGIDAAKAVVDLLDPEPAKQVRDAISEIQVMYAGASGGSPASDSGPKPGVEPTAQEPEPGADAPREPKAPPGLWTPPGV